MMKSYKNIQTMYLQLVKAETELLTRKPKWNQFWAIHSLKTNLFHTKSR